MKNNKIYNDVYWLHLSDLHVYSSTDMNLLLNSYKALAKKIRVQFIVVTGDYRHIENHPDYGDALSFLNEIVQIFRIDKKDIFLAPGNHDVEDYEMREEIITTIRMQINKNTDAYLRYVDLENHSLGTAFEKYSDFVRAFYNNEVRDSRIKDPWRVQCIQWDDKINIVILNTALISDGDRKHKEIVDINALSQLNIDTSLPAIVLAHHDINSLEQSHKERLIRLLATMNVRAYLCGDKHILELTGIEKYDIPGTSIPCIVCGKSTIQQDDTYSDVGVIHYVYKTDGKAYVQVYKWGDKYALVKDSKFYSNIDEPYSFYMNIPADFHSVEKHNRKKITYNKEPTRH